MPISPSRDLAIGPFSDLEDHARAVLAREITSVSLKSGARVFRPGDAASNYLLVKSGSVRVSVVTEQGREIVLYRVRAGETCVLTTTGLMTGAAYEAEALAEESTEAYMMPKATFEDLLASSQKFRQLVFSSLGEKLHTLISLVQEVTLRHVDKRLARHLIAHARHNHLDVTHQAIANELNTAREVVTRLLHDFSERGWIETSRGHIEILNAAELDKFSTL